MHKGTPNANLVASVRKCRMWTLEYLSYSVVYAPQKRCGEPTTEEIVQADGHLEKVYLCAKGHRMPTRWVS